jgi:hypothetical protein
MTANEEGLAQQQQIETDFIKICQCANDICLSQLFTYGALPYRHTKCPFSSIQFKYIYLTSFNNKDYSFLRCDPTQYNRKVTTILRNMQPSSGHLF